MRVDGGGVRPGQHGPQAALQCLASHVPVPGPVGDEGTAAQVKPLGFDPNAKGLDWAGR